ncbi:MAG: ribonuclease P protein component [Puniceicoccales bacterium]|nr:ribonuclease P protein component [Puniceicoccales bacterium]
MGERLFRSQRICSSTEFAKFRSCDAFWLNSELFTLKILDAGQDISRLGVIVSKKVGNAVVRNRIRRVVREIFRKNLQKRGKSYDYLVIAKQPIRQANYEKIESELLNGATKIYEQMSKSCSLSDENLRYP